MAKRKIIDKKEKTVSGQINSTIQFILDERVEFFRSSIALLPDGEDKKHNVAFININVSKNREERFCTCNTSNRKTCSHIKELLEIYKGMAFVHGENRFEENFQSSIWYQLFKVLVEKNNITPEFILATSETNSSENTITAMTDKSRVLVSYHGVSADKSRFIERCTSYGNEKNSLSRKDVFKKLKYLFLNETEREMVKKGYKTRKMAQEDSFWYFFAYHCFREFDNQEFIFKTDIKKNTCEYLLICMDKEHNPVFEIYVPRDRINEIEKKIEKFHKIKRTIPTHSIPMEPVLSVTLKNNEEIKVSPVYRFVDHDQSVTFYSKENLKPYEYGNLFYIKDKNTLVDVLPSHGIVNKFIENNENIIPEKNIPEFLFKYGNELNSGPHQVDPAIKNLKIIDTFDTMTIKPQAIQRDWCWLSIDYGIGECSVSLKDILDVCDRDERFIKTTNGWIDTASPNMDGFSVFTKISNINPSKGNGKLGFSRLDLLKLRIFGRMIPDIEGDDKTSEQIKNIIEMRPLTKVESYDGMTSTLREYQKTGADWIRYLYENRFGGLLCDDMGLGKTHQIMAFMLYLKKSESVQKPFLVVCPTSVLSHWEHKIKEHIPDISAVIYYGVDRDFDTDIKAHHVIITTYGILWRDCSIIAKYRFQMAVFDEAQMIKNSETKVYKAATKIKANIKLCVTGTPIENNIGELKSLMDIVNPGYLGSSAEFKERYVKPIENNTDFKRNEELHKMIFPFILRRLKKTVLDELPEKIENITTCQLSDDQVRLYQEAISSRGAGLLNTLSDNKKNIPYIHIFALLTLLKQICNHPALTFDTIADYKKYTSGKWEIFKELLTLCLENDQKIVVYSQFLGMIEIMKKYLSEKSIPFVSLTGASKDRGKIIDTFNNDSKCRVFVGSLKAGGVGFDLVAASLVIHYDRWWNAAKEDQATDRVHRIGQKRGVQVFKLVTEGTLEEKISAIIEKKRNLMDSLVKEDDPNVIKTFTREELVEILSVSAYN